MRLISQVLVPTELSTSCGKEQPPVVVGLTSATLMQPLRMLDHGSHYPINIIAASTY